MARTLSTELEQGPPESLFHQLFGGRSHMEVNVSKAFAMCFRESDPFAKAVLDLLHKTCRVVGPRHNCQWHCDTEVTFAKGRPDIEIHVPGVRFRLENKVGAPLTTGQLLRYRCRKKGEYLVALTKRPPDVGNKWMTRKGVFSIRWQDVHRAVAHAPAKNGRDRYLRDSFCLYLEELTMAHREDIRAADLQRLHELFNTIASDRTARVAPRNGFGVAESCLHLLRELARDARDEIPALQRWGRRGPAYVREVMAADDLRHHLGFHFRRNGGAEWLGAGFTFSQNKTHPQWEVWRGRKRDGLSDYRWRPLKTVCGKAGGLDRGKMLRSFTKVARELGAKI